MTSTHGVPDELPSMDERAQLARCALQRRWDVSFVLAGWLHLAAFLLCYYLTVERNYHASGGYLAIWLSELCGMWGIFRLCGGRRRADMPAGPLEKIIRRVWIGYFVLAFDLGSLNTLRGNEMFEFFPAIAPLASFALLMMTVLVNRRFFAAVVLMYLSGLLMAANLPHAYLIFALDWWLVLNGIGIMLRLQRHRPAAEQSSSPSVEVTHQCRNHSLPTGVS
jgi:hypothetical protein